jgi:hypothetical protein
MLFELLLLSRQLNMFNIEQSMKKLFNIIQRNLYYVTTNTFHRLILNKAVSAN